MISERVTSRPRNLNESQLGQSHFCLCNLMVSKRLLEIHTDSFRKFKAKKLAADPTWTLEKVRLLFVKDGMELLV